MDSAPLNKLPAKWEERFDEITLARGREIQRNGQVLECRVGGDFPGITAKVQGSRPTPYNVRVNWSAHSKGRLVLDSECSCPMEFDCKHVVAAILQASAFSKSAVPAAPTKMVKVAPKLSDQAKSWLDQLHQATTPPPSAPMFKPGEEPQRVAYVLQVEKVSGYNSTPNQKRISVSIQIVRKLLNGGYGQGTNSSPDLVLNQHQRADYVTEQDIAILRRLKLLQPQGNFYGTHVLTGSEGASLLEDMLRTGHCHWRGTGKKHPPLILAPSRAAKLEWLADNHGMQSPSLAVTPAATAILPLAPPWYVDTNTHACGPLDIGLPGAVAEAWLNAPTLTPDQAELLGEELVRRYPDLVVPAPRRIEIETIDDLKPVPCLRLYSHKIAQQNYGYYYGRTRGPESLDLNLARLEFDYGGQRLLSGSPEKTLEQFQDGKLRRIKRQFKFELLEASRLVACGFSEARTLYYNYNLGKQGDALTLNDANQWFRFTQYDQPELIKVGWRVEADESFHFRIVEPENWYADADEASGIDWFGVEIGVQLDGKKLNLLPILLDQIQRNPQLISEEGLAAQPQNGVIPITLPDGRLLAFPVSRLKEMLGVLLELFEPKALDRSGRLRLSKLRAAEFSDLASDNAQWRWLGNKELSALGKRLRGFGGVQTVVPSKNLRAELRGYQQNGLNWLQFLREYELGGILADDMGLGKTVQALAHLLHEHESGRMDRPSLVIAPTSLMTNWRQEAERFTPALRVLVLHGTERKQHFEKIKDHDLIITSYPLLPRDQATLLQEEFHYVILDEAQFIKNPKTQYAQIVCQLKARHRLCLTGTPMENHLSELWSLFNFLLPGFLADETRFRKVFRNPIEKGQSEERRKLLAHRVAPFMLRRRKEEVVKELPPKTEIIQNVELTGAQRDLYETIRLAMHARVREEVSKKGLSRSHIIILDALLKLRQVCCDPRLLPMESAKKIKESAKLQLLMDLLPEMLAEGRRILLFSQFTTMLKLIEEELAIAKIPYVLLTGQTTDRATPVEQFQSGQVPLFLISLKAGGTGLNLTAADTVIHYDPWWNPAVENQATDRAHRIGQEKKVFVYKLMTVGTVETKIQELQARKRDLVAGLLDENRKEPVNLKSEDLEVLFAPIG